MPSTEYNVDQIIRRFPKESPESILGVINEIQKLVCSQDSYQFEKIESTGMPPFLATTDGIYEYDCPVDCRRTIAVFTLNRNSGYKSQKSSGLNSEFSLRNRNYTKVAISTRAKTPRSVGKIYFQDNPGTTTNKYYHAYYTVPQDLTDISMQLLIPDEAHYILREGVIAMLTSDEYGKGQLDEAIMQKTIKKIRAVLNKGEGATVGRVGIRECDYEVSTGRTYQ